jgi:dGTPase
VLSGRISLSELAQPLERAAVAELAAKHFSDEPAAALEDAAVELLRLPAVAALAEADYDGSLGAQVALKLLTSELVGRFAAAAITETRRLYGDGPLCRYGADLEVPALVAAEVALLKAVALRYVMSDPHRLALQAVQREQLTELATVLTDRAPDVLDPAFRPAWLAAADDTERLRVVVDQVASLTDAQAIAWYDRFCLR